MRQPASHGQTLRNRTNARPAWHGLKVVRVYRVTALGGTVTRRISLPAISMHLLFLAESEAT